MRLHDDLHQPALVRAADLPWSPSPMAGVERRMLYREGNEVARATTIVRYAAGSSFSSHGHPGGEAYVVLDGVFQDEAGDHGAGHYVRNPPGSRHTPRSEPGCTILVWLYQFDRRDTVAVDLDIERVAPLPDTSEDGVSRRVLCDGHERVLHESSSRGARSHHDLIHGGELFVLAGEVEVGADRLGPWSWLRRPAGSELRITTRAPGTCVLLRVPKHSLELFELPGA